MSAMQHHGLCWLYCRWECDISHTRTICNVLLAHSVEYCTYDMSGPCEVTLKGSTDNYTVSWLCK